MNIDYVVPDIGLREKQYKRNINSKGDTRHYDDSCKTINKYAHEQNTVYDPMTNQILYGINSNMHVSGVSDGTCNQINPLMFTPNYICGAGTAGGNRCVHDEPNAYEPNAYEPKVHKPNTNTIENFESNINGYNITKLVIFVLIILIFIAIVYSKYNKII